MNNQITDKRIFLKFWIIGLFTFGMIVWTVFMAIKAGAGHDNDDAFLSSYHEIDRDFNKILQSNRDFEAKYNIKFILNGNEIVGLTYKDVYLGQRSIAKRKDRKNLINVGNNILKIMIQDKMGHLVHNKDIKILITQAISHDNDINLEFKNEDIKKFNVKAVGYWNLTGVVEVGKNKGYFYIKTNAKK